MVFLLCLLQTLFYSSSFLLSLLCLWAFFLCVIFKSSKVDCDYRLISDNPCIVTRWNYSSISRTKFFFRTIVHDDLNASRYHVLCMGSFIAVCFYDRFDTFIPTPSWFKRYSSNSSAIFKCS